MYDMYVANSSHGSAVEWSLILIYDLSQRSRSIKILSISFPHFIVYESSIELLSLSSINNTECSEVRLRCTS